MASRSAGSRSSRGRAEDEDAGGWIAGMIARHRVALGGATAFAVAFAYVSANAMWYQPHAHGTAFFQTRPLSPNLALGPAQEPERETIIRIEEAPADGGPPALPSPRSAVAEQDSDEIRQAAVPLPAHPETPSSQGNAARAGDLMILEVQRVLASLKFYDGEVDGITGPQTRSAIQAYRSTMGLSASADIDAQLLDQLGIASSAFSPPIPQGSPGTDLIETASAVPVEPAPRADQTVMRIQAGLKAFGNDGIEIDGVVGSRTRSAILEFQSLFGLPETGNPDDELYAKMREIGLTD